MNEQQNMFVNNRQNSVKIPTPTTDVNEVSNESEAFQTPRKVAKISTRQPNERYSLNTSNRYNPLIDHSYSNSNTMDHQSLDDPAGSSSSNVPLKKVKIPPIFVHQAENYQKLVEDVKSVVKCNFVTENKGDKIKLLLEDPNDFRALTAFYDTNGVQYHSFKLNLDDEISVVIRNIPLSLTEPEIKQELEALDFPVKKVVRLLNRVKNPIPLCVVDLTNNQKAKEIFGLERLFYSVVSVEPRRKPKDIPQCSRCQRFGHTKNFCNLSPRCVKCPGDHLYTECKKPNSEAPICVNCSGNHSANYRGCDYFKNLKLKTGSAAKTNEKGDQNTPVRTANSTKVDQPKPAQTKRNVSYSTALKGTEKRVTPPSSDTNVNSNEDTEDDDKFISILVKFIKPFIPKIKSFVMQLFKNIFDHVSSD